MFLIRRLFMDVCVYGDLIRNEDMSLFLANIHFVCTSRLRAIRLSGVKMRILVDRGRDQVMFASFFVINPPGPHHRFLVGR
jgi:hypothetical protein